MNLGAIRSFIRVHFELDEEDMPDVLIDTWVEEASARILRMRRDWPHLETVTTIVLEPGVATYPLPSNLKSIAHIEHPTTGRLEWLHEGVAEDKFFRQGTPQSGNPTAYSRWQQEIQVWPVPNAAANLTVRGYRNTISAITAGAGAEPDLPADFHLAVLEWAMAKAYLHQDDPELAAVHRETFDDLVNVLVPDEVQPEPDQPLIFGGGGVMGNSSDGQDQAANYFLFPWGS